MTMKRSWKRAVNLWSTEQRGADGYWEARARGAAKLMVYSAVPEKEGRAYLSAAFGDGVGYHRLNDTWTFARVAMEQDHIANLHPEQEKVVTAMLNEFFEDGDRTLVEVAFDHLEEHGLHDWVWLSCATAVRPDHDCELRDWVDFACEYLIERRQVPIPEWIDRVVPGLTTHGQTILMDLVDGIIKRGVVVYVWYYNEHMELISQYAPLDRNDETSTYIVAEDLYKPFNIPAQHPHPDWLSDPKYAFIGVRGETDAAMGRYFHPTATFAIIECGDIPKDTLRNLPIVLNPFKTL